MVNVPIEDILITSNNADVIDASDNALSSPICSWDSIQFRYTVYGLCSRAQAFVYML